MKWTGLNEVREKYLSFFESKNHTRLPSAPLVPQGDNSLLLINSGMAPLKKYFLGQETPPNVRVTTCQKCIRTPDIERVGKTARHGTYFEMLGNFSFGDYFKEEATTWAWEFCTQVLELPADKLYVSVYEEDDEAYDIWTKRRGVSPDHMVRLGKADNFWEHGSGPCGPCSEIYFDRGEDYGCGSSDCAVGCDCDRFVEFWNLVFTQFDSDGNGHYEKMAKPNIDTGMGLERLACILQGVGNLFEVDTVQNIMKHISTIAGVTYRENERTDVSLRVITDHIRSTTFMVGDGVMPSNEGRGYVLRRLLRRAARHGRLLGVTEPFLYKVCDTVISENASAYPELAEKREYIQKIIRVEEENFAKTVDKGMELLSQILGGIQSKGGKVLGGEDAFRLSDTFGFPLDLTIEIAQEKGISVDEKRFHELVQEQRAKARADRAAKGGSSWSEDTMGALTLEPTVFTGYSVFEGKAGVLGLFKDGQPVNSITEGDEGILILSETPFYAESGGQVGDKGIISIGESVFTVSDTKKVAGGQYLHIGSVDAGSFTVGDTVGAAVDKKLRLATMRSHSCAHLLQAALREVLGDHVHQAGQLVDAERLRFDFAHFSALTPEELEKIENIVNAKILEANPVAVSEMPIEEARKLGAMALFGEKYGSVVRVVNINNYSIEFCGGTHMDNSSKIGLFKIVSENSVAAGIRRIEAVTGTGVLDVLNQEKGIITSAAQALKLANAGELVTRCGAIASEVKALEKQVEALNSQLAAGKIDGLLENAVSVNGVRIVCGLFKGMAPEILRTMGDKLRDKAPDAVALLAGTSESGGTLVCTCGKDALDRGAHAGKIVKEASALAGGKGGGRPDSAMAGIGDNTKIEVAFQGLKDIVAALVK